MSPILILFILGSYFLMLIAVSFITGKKGDNEAFFLGNRQSPWFVVAFGMIGASLSGVTFISVPGWVGSSQWSYMQMVLGYLLGYLVIGAVLLPLYYRLQLTSIYTYLVSRFGPSSYKTGASFFLLSRVIGSAFRLFLVANVFQIAIFSNFNVPFWVTILITIALIWLYTRRSGIKTIIWTDTFQTAALLIAVIASIYMIAQALGLSLSELPATIAASDLSQTFFFDDARDARFFPKQFLAGAFIAIVMTGLDQDMMQKNLTCRSLKDAQKNMFWFSLVLVFVNLLFMALGVLLYAYADAHQITEVGDNLYPFIATQGGLGLAVGILFMVGLVAAAYSSADSALTALTTSFCVDILNINRFEESRRVSIRKQVHILFSFVLFFTILIFHAINDESVIKAIFTVAGYTYGPLLGLYAFGLFTKRQVIDRWVPVLAVLSPILTYAIRWLVLKYFDFNIGFELLIINGAITFAGLWMLTEKPTTHAEQTT
jgi:solute:Na+ symporter, SSS family